MRELKSGKTTSSLLNKLLQDALRPRLTNAIDKLCCGDHSAPPLAALVDLTTRCNLHCSWCIDKYALSDIEIPTARMLSLLDEFERLKITSIVYFGGGEPLFHPGIGDILKKTHELNIDYAVNTNGILIDKVLSNIADNSCWTRISWDAADEKTYKAMHNNIDCFPLIVRNTENLAKVAKGTVGISFVVMDANVHEMAMAASLAKDSGCDFIQFKPMYTPLLSNKRILTYYSDETSTRAQLELAKATEMEDDGFVVLVTASLKTVLDRKPINQARSYNYCAAQQFVTLVNEV